MNKNVTQILCSVFAAILIATLSGVVTTVVELARMADRQDRQGLQLDKAEDNLTGVQLAVASLQAVVISQGTQITRVDNKLDMKQ